MIWGVIRLLYLFTREMKKTRFIRVENLKKNTVYWDEVKEIIEGLEEENRNLREELLKVKDEYSDLWEKYLEMRDYVDKAYLVTLK